MKVLFMKLKLAKCLVNSSPVVSEQLLIDGELELKYKLVLIQCLSTTLLPLVFIENLSYGIYIREINSFIVTVIILSSVY